MKERFIPALQVQALQFERGKVKKHRAAEELGKRLIPQILASRENLGLFFAGIETIGYREKVILEKMFLPQIVSKSLKQPPKAEVFSFLSEELKSENLLRKEVATGFFEGIFLYPLRLYQKDKKRPDQAIKAATETLYNFAWVMVFSHHSVQEKALLLFEKIILSPQGKKLFDLASRSYLLSSPDWEESLSHTAAAILFLDSLFIKQFGQERYKARFGGFLDPQILNSQLGVYLLDQQRRVRIKELISATEENLEKLELGIEKALSQNAGTIRFCPFSDQESLMNETGRLQMEIAKDSLLKERGMESAIIEFPEGSKVLVFYEPGALKKEAEKEIIRGSILNLLSKPPVYRERLGVKALATIIDFLGPNYSPEVLASSFPSLYERVQTGILALPGAGLMVQLRRPEEEFLRQMGLTSLFFKPYGEGGVLAKLEFGNYHFSFALDKNFRPRVRREAAFWEKFSHLDEEKKIFLLNLAYAYLDSLLHPQRKDEEILGVRKKRKEGESEYLTPEETRDYLRERIHLRVLPLGYHSHKKEDEEANEKIRERFGYSFKEIWEVLNSVEGDLTTLDRFKESKPRLWGVVRGLLKRIEAKPEGVQWVKVDGQKRMKVLNPPPPFAEEKPSEEEGLFSQERGIFYEVTAILVTESPYPRVVVCPKAATRIISGI